QERGGLGKYGCFELVFPIAMTLPDGTTTESLDSYDELKQTLRDWFQANGKQGGRRGRPHGGGQGNHPGGGQGGSNRPHPSFVFPVTVISQAGETISVEDEAELRALRAECGGTFGQHSWQGHGQHGLSCFEIVFPVTVQFPDGTTAQAADGPALRQLVRTWRQSNAGATTRPSLVFPIAVKMKDDGSVVTLNSKEELLDLKAAGCN
ncbi:MAG: hypothetical protein ACKVUS_02880, partial [Saprospiraceae bacterium]